jgi:hypothetical protein
VNSDSDGEVYSDRKWREKLAAEADFEYAERMGRFQEVEEEENATYGREETYDDWADRIYRAFSDRRRQVPILPIF